MTRRFHMIIRKAVKANENLNIDELAEGWCGVGQGENLSNLLNRAKSLDQRIKMEHE
jgi:hypothetical protein